MSSQFWMLNAVYFTLHSMLSNLFTGPYVLVINLYYGECLVLLLPGSVEAFH